MLFLWIAVLILTDMTVMHTFIEVVSHTYVMLVFFVLSLMLADASVELRGQLGAQVAQERWRREEVDLLDGVAPDPVAQPSRHVARESALHLLVVVRAGGEGVPL